MNTPTYKLYPGYILFGDQTDVGLIVHAIYYPK